MKDKHRKHNTEHHVHSEQPHAGTEELSNEASPGQDPHVTPPVSADPAVAASPDDAAPVEVLQPAKSEPAKTENDDKYLRLMADFDNFRKRTVRERSELYQRANEDIIEEILPVLDHIDLALKSAVEHKTDAGVIDGFRLVAEQLMSALKKSGLSPIEVAKGAVFDPSVHEAISHMPSEAVQENMVIAQVRRGYMLGGKMLRATQVVVSSGKQLQNAPEIDQPEVSVGGK